MTNLVNVRNTSWLAKYASPASVFGAIPKACYISESSFSLSRTMVTP